MISDERQEKMQDTENHSPPNKMLQRPDSLENKDRDSTDHSKAKCIFTEFKKEIAGPVTLHRIIHTTIVLFMVQITFF